MKNRLTDDINETTIPSGYAKDASIYSSFSISLTFHPKLWSHIEEDNGHKSFEDTQNCLEKTKNS